MANTVGVIIPAYNEAQSIGLVLKSIPFEKVQQVVVVNNGSTDETAKKAREMGAKVVDAPMRGYGNACQTGIAYLLSLENPPEIIVFLDGDYSDYPEEISLLTRPIEVNQADLVIGSRVHGTRQKGALLPHQVFGNWLAVNLIRFMFGYKYSDLGPFRAIRGQSLKLLSMRDSTYGWTVEMQVKAAKYGLRVVEVPVRYRKRLGKSKVSGTIKGSFLAAYKIIFTIFKEKVTPLRQF
jgi:glycosyltransferase involved in cell wall biosynthesis